MNIVIGPGNEGAAGKHAEGILSDSPAAEPEIIEWAVGEFENTFNLEIWKNFYEQFEVVLIAPNGTRVGPIPERLGTQSFASRRKL